MELLTLVIYDIEDDRSRTRVAEACKDFGLQRLQYSCFRGKLSANKREELLERLLRIQREWESRWLKDFPEAKFEPLDAPGLPEHEPQGRWAPAFKIMIQPMCEKDIKTALYAYLFVDVAEEEREEDGNTGEISG
jgi:hypothetical protein